MNKKLLAVIIGSPTSFCNQ